MTTTPDPTHWIAVLDRSIHQGVPGFARSAVLAWCAQAREWRGDDVDLRVVDVHDRASVHVGDVELDGEWLMLAVLPAPGARLTVEARRKTDAYPTGTIPPME